MIEAELEVLMQAFAERPEAAERLSQILAQDPERFAEIVAGMDAVAVEALARLLRRLGQEAIGVVLACTFDAEDAVVRVNALALLKALVAAGRAEDRAGGEIDRHLHESQEAYLLLDRLVQGPWSRQAKAEVLCELAEASCDEQAKGWPDGGRGRCCAVPCSATLTRRLQC